jgi:hypothetical protein
VTGGRKRGGPSDRRECGRRKGVEEGRVLADVHAKSVRGPAAEGLNTVVGPPARGEKGSSPRAQRVSAEGAG